MPAPPLPHLLDRQGASRIERLVRESLTDEEPPPPGPHALLCAACHHPITDERLRIRVQGSHHHQCVNPAGVTFRVSCFGEAAGAVAIGPPEAEHSWFPGHRWQYALCGDCGEHLGWRYSGIGEFFGLIEEKLRRPATPS